MADREFLKDSYVQRDADETRAHYDAWASTYDAELVENNYATPRNVLKALEAFGLDRTTTILDVGCGTGLFGRELAAAGYTTVDGCDYSPGMLTRAKDTGFYRQLFEVNLNEPPLSFDGQRLESDCYGAAAVVGVFSFGHVEPVALDEITRVVQPDGVIVIGLNDKFWSEGSLKRKIDEMQANGVLEVVEIQPGDHLPGTGLSGWFISLRVTN